MTLFLQAYGEHGPVFSDPGSGESGSDQTTKAGKAVPESGGDGGSSDTSNETKVGKAGPPSA